MADIKIPELGESITEATIIKWVKKPGDSVGIGDILLELETDKVNLEVGAEKSGTLREILADAGEDVQIGQVVGHIDTGDGGGDGSAPTKEPKAEESKPAPKEEAKSEPEVKRESKPEAKEAPKQESEPATASQPARQTAERSAPVEKEEYEALPKQTGKSSQPSRSAPAKSTPPKAAAKTGGEAREETVKLSRRRRTIAANLIHAQSTAAMLTTFNEVDMSAVIEMRKRHQGRFVEAHGIKLGFTSFFVKAVVSALKEYPQVNAELADESTLVMKYH
jgi:2-oxoglutarate dehydrogenase E2 component (dihydrolipoamide succinyltransferase)